VYDEVRGRRSFPGPGLHLLTGDEYVITRDNWRHIRSKLPMELGRIVEYGTIHNSVPCWTCTPNKSTAPEMLPLTIAGAPVIIPVLHPIPIRAGVASPDDPLEEAIHPSRPIPDPIIQAIFECYPDASGFYLLLNGYLQILVPAEFDLEDAYDTYPSRFGGLKVSYVLEGSGPRPTHYDAPLELLGSSGYVNCKGKRFGMSKLISSKLGVKLQDETGNMALTLPTHLIQKKLVAEMADPSQINEHNFLQVLVYTNATMGHNVSPKIGQMKHCYDLDIFETPQLPFPHGYEHDTSLVKVNDPFLWENFKAAPNTQWLSRDDFMALKFEDTRIFFLDSISRDFGQAKSIPLPRGPACHVGPAHIV
jgi:hypothetical protein